MKLKEYIAILQTFNPEVEVLKKAKRRCGHQSLIPLEMSDINPPHVHFKYNIEKGYETLVDSIII